MTSNIAYQTPRVVHGRVLEWVVGLLVSLLLLCAYAKFDEEEQRGFWQAEVGKKEKEHQDFKGTLIFAVRSDGQCFQKDVRKNWELSVARMCDVVKSHLSASR